MADPAPNLNVAMDLTGWLDEHTRDMDAAVADLIQICCAAEKQAYSCNIDAYRMGITRLILERPDQLGAQAIERAARVCFLNAIGKFISFLDKLIASQKNATEGIPINRDIADLEDLKRYIVQHTDEQIARVASDRALSNPKKLDCFPGLDADVRSRCLGYFQLRRTLEHHQDLPERDLNIFTKRAGLFIDDSEVRELPHPIRKGQKMEVRILNEQKRFTGGKKIVLSPQDAHDLAFTLRNFLAPEIFKAHIGAGK